MRKKAQNTQKPDNFILQKYRFTLREYKKKVKEAKLRSWQRFVTSLGNKEPWSFVYRQQADKLRVKKVINTLRKREYFTKTVEKTARCLLNVHIPDNQEIKIR